MFAAIGRAAEELSGEARGDLPPFQGGFAGLASYELGNCFEPVHANQATDLPLPTLAVGWYDVVAAFDHQRQSAWLISQGWPETDAAARRERAAYRLRQFRDRLENAPRQRSVDARHVPRVPLERLAPQHATGRVAGLTSSFSRAEYLRSVRRAIDYIDSGDVFQVNLAQRLMYPADGTAAELYCRLRQRNPAPFAGYLDGGDWQLASASPERFLRVSGGYVETRPIKGTAPRTGQRQADLELARRLSDSAKDRAENVMIVDLLRNDLSRSCRPESVQVSQLCGLESYAWVQHLVSVVEGRLREDQSPSDLLRHCFPGGSVTGAPKIRAREIIAEIEPTPRGAYCGSLVYWGVNGQMDSNLLIRTITAHGGWWQLPVGGGIIAQSNPQQEYEETWTKAQGMLHALNH
jgi:para-aminobenzoate synthetase component 1